MTDAQQNTNGSTDPEEVWKVAATCRVHWRMKGVPDARADEMEEELASHLARPCEGEGPSRTW